MSREPVRLRISGPEGGATKLPANHGKPARKSPDFHARRRLSANRAVRRSGDDLGDWSLQPSEPKDVDRGEFVGRRKGRCPGRHASERARFSRSVGRGRESETPPPPTPSVWPLASWSVVGAKMPFKCSFTVGTVTWKSSTINSPLSSFGSSLSRRVARVRDWG